MLKDQDIKSMWRQHIKQLEGINTSLKKIISRAEEKEEREDEIPQHND